MFPDPPRTAAFESELAVTRRRVLFCFLAALVMSVPITLMITMLEGCASPPDPRVAASGAEMQVCVARAMTRAESRACREGVRGRYPDIYPNFFDGGAP